MTSQAYYFVRGYTGEYEDYKEWVAGNNYFINKEGALGYLKTLEELAEKVNSLNTISGREETEEFSKLEELDYKAMVDYTGVNYVLQKSILNFL